ncbi:hypothetical protein C8R45DRAFT_1101267 [Mycena sanguinolenta]|nr:hypothetical protein C8R45DRAFT_1101267 [Mycena sanguinolenta]
MIFHPWVPRPLNATQVSFLRERMDEYHIARARHSDADNSFERWHAERCAVVAFVTGTAQAFIDTFGWGEAATDGDRDKYVLDVRAKAHVQIADYAPVRLAPRLVERQPLDVVPEWLFLTTEYHSEGRYGMFGPTQAETATPARRALRRLPYPGIMGGPPLSIRDPRQRPLLRILDPWGRRKRRSVPLSANDLYLTDARPLPTVPTGGHTCIVCNGVKTHPIV